MEKRLRKSNPRWLILIILVLAAVTISAQIQLNNLAKTHGENTQRLEKVTETQKTNIKKINSLEETITVNETLVKENDDLRKTVNQLALAGVSRGNHDVTNTLDLENMKFTEYAGEFSCSFYTPSVDECDGDPWSTASGKKTVVNYTCAVDNTYWKFGTIFYVVGFGFVEAADTGGSVKGRNRLDICVATKKQAFDLGRPTLKVWMVEKNES